MNAKKIVEHIRVLLPQAQKKALPREIAVISVTSEKSGALNNAYREKDRPTNVLSFYYNKTYGEIIICPSVIRHEAHVQGNTYTHQMTWMILHGMLHLGGVHHETSDALARKAEELEGKILKKAESKN